MSACVSVDDLCFGESCRIYLYIYIVCVSGWVWATAAATAGNAVDAG